MYYKLCREKNYIMERNKEIEEKNKENERRKKHILMFNNIKHIIYEHYTDILNKDLLSIQKYEALNKEWDLYIEEYIEEYTNISSQGKNDLNI